jgi:hypothetical protein
MNGTVLSYLGVLAITMFQTGTCFAPAFQLSQCLIRGSRGESRTFAQWNLQKENQIINIDDDYNTIHHDNDDQKFTVDKERRNAIHLMLGTMGMCTMYPQIGNADENLLELDQKKAVMQISSKNYPRKYESSSVTMSDKTNAIDPLTEAEERRIDVFERVAPSVGEF